MYDLVVTQFLTRMVSTINSIKLLQASINS